MTTVTASAGVAPNKFLAKVASDWNKPDGLTLIRPDQVQEFVKSLPVSKIPGVGKVTTRKLASLSIKTCEDIQKIPLKKLEVLFGKWGSWLHQISHGIDHRPVGFSGERKSLSLEHTYPQDLDGIDQLHLELSQLVLELTRRFSKWKKKKSAQVSIKNAFVKMKFNDFQKVTVEKARDPDFFSFLWKDEEPTDEFLTYLEELLKMAYEKGKKPVRLLGLGVRFGHYDEKDQLPLFTGRE